MINVINLSKIFADKKLFEDVNVSFKNGNTYGIIGANGAGKSTFLKILSNKMEASNGEIIIEKGKRLSVLEQDQNKYDEEVVTDVVIMGHTQLFEIQKEKDAIYANPDSTEKDFEKAADLEEQFGNMGGWNSDNDAQMLLEGLNIGSDKWNLQLKELKANEKVKVLLAKTLFGDPDILIMDEPTNNLDLKSIKWLENFLVNYDNLVLVVSHDSDFLDQVCTHIADVDFGAVKIFTGNYTFWKESSKLAGELQKRHNDKKEAQIEKLKEFIAKFSANASKSSQATSRKKSLEKIQLDDIKPSNRKYPYINWDINREPGKDILTVNNLGYKNSEGVYLFQNLNFSIHANEKLAIIGDDDLAKTALLEILNGIKEPSEGTFNWGITMKKDYLPVDNSSFFDSELNIIDWVSQWPSENSLPENQDNADSRMRSFLGRMLFSNDSVYKKVNVTSGGEKARLMFTKMMLTESNFLMLNQPLEHLDSESIDSVVEAVNNYKSSLMFTTYNRGMIKKCANAILDMGVPKPQVERLSLTEYEKKMGY